ncbi:hypothetical protein EDD17DRAFT_1505761 [Pisolithus thermaeus]|nr:hypothetical protein EDD17DRAFT_1505761 [Pisolithus thermaeus]
MFGVNEEFPLTPTRLATYRAFTAKTRPLSPMSDSLFHYTSGLWLYNNNLRLEERTPESVGRGPDDVARLKKLAEGGFNCTFVITVHDGCRMVTRIPYSVTVPKPFDIASEVATMTFLRFRGLPIPEVFDYPPKPDNTAGTEYIFMAYVNDDSLDNICHDLTEEQIDSFLIY